MSFARSWIERVILRCFSFGHYGFYRCRAFGLTRNDAHLQLFAGAYNLKTALCLL